jgi:hypothetical protein
MLRRLGCVLPIEVWHLGKAEMSEEMAKLLAPMGVKVVDGLKVRRKYPLRELNGWELKPYALLHSRFREALLLDADNVPVINPEFLFESAEFKETGAIFWPDFNHTASNNQLHIWRSCGLRRPSELEFETGQILVDKARCWRALNLCMWFNENSDFYYQHIHGDKETFHLAFRKVKKSYHLTRHPIHALDATMCQHDTAGRRLFQHRNLAKWDLVRNRRINGFWYESECVAYLNDLKLRWDGNMASFPNLKVGASRTARKLPRIAAVIAPGVDEAGARHTIENLARTDWADAPGYMQLSAKESHVEWSHRFHNAISSGADYLLVLQGNLLFNTHLYRNLSSWKPIRSQRTSLASLYNPHIKEAAYDFTNNARVAASRQRFGNEALVLSIESAKYIVKRARWIKNLAEVDFSKVASALKRPILFHAPSLAQRKEEKMVSDAVFPQAFDFDPNWRA